VTSFIPYSNNSALSARILAISGLSAQILHSQSCETKSPIYPLNGRVDS
jgi:hypothetical protein